MSFRVTVFNESGEFDVVEDAGPRVHNLDEALDISADWFGRRATAQQQRSVQRITVECNGYSGEVTYNRRQIEQDLKL